MKKGPGVLRGGIKAALLGGCALGMFTADMAVAQDKSSETLDEIVVVGSRIRRDTFNSPSPVQVVTREEATAAGLVSVADLLQSNAVSGGSSQINGAYGGFVTNGGPGASTISLRGLGAGRTLVLVNGRRVAPAGVRGSLASADLNSLPTAMVQRVEVLKDGASSVYGSDAVAGVLNIITEPNVDGVTIEGTANRTAHGEGDQTRLSVVGGTKGDRWKVAGSVEYYDRGKLSLADRSWTRCNTDYMFDPATGASADYIDPLTGKPKCYPLTDTGSNGVTINTLGTSTQTGTAAPGATGTRFNRWRPNPAVTTGPLAGFEGVGGSGVNLNVRDTFDPAMLEEDIISPVKTTTAFAQASYELDALGNAELYTELLFSNRKSEQTSYRQLSLDYPNTSPLVPANLQGLGYGLGSSLFSGNGLRAFIGYGNSRSEQEVNFYKTTNGIRGDIPFLPDWKYDLYGSYTKSDGSYSTPSFITSKLAESVDVVAAPGSFSNAALMRRGADGTTNVICRVTVNNPGKGCIPAPVLNAQTIGGKLPDDWKDYIFDTVWGKTIFQETMFSGGVNGPVFSLPAGKVQAAIGAEYRHDKINDTPALESQNGDLLNLTSSKPTRGSDSVFEVYGEVEVPLLADLPLIKSLTVNGSGRYTDYDSYGSDWTYKVGGEYQPFGWLSLRGTYGTSFRAPALYEQFLGATSGFLSSNSDPCYEYGNATNPNRRANCAAELPGQPDFRQTQGITVLSQGGAGTGLEAETSDNLTVGTVITPELPEAFGQFAFAVDYFDIEIKNGVDRVGGSSILSQCYNSPDFRAGGGLCNLVTRDPVTNALTVTDAYTNVSSQLVRGFDYNARWTGDIGPVSLRINATLTKYNSQKSRTFSTDAYDEYNGTIGNPEWVGQLSNTVGYKEWKFTYTTEWLSATESWDLIGVDPATDPYIFKTDAYYLHHAALSYEAEDWSATLGIRNIFDKNPPQISSGYYNRVGNAPLYSGYDYVGRQFFLNMSKKF